MARAPRMKAEERRQQIFDVALREFATRGYHLAKIRVIADRAGVSEPVIYQHFPGKQQLYLELLLEIGKEIFGDWEDAVRCPSSPQEILFTFGMAFYRRVAETPEAARLVFQSFTEVGIPEVREFSRTFQLALHEKVSGVIREGVARGFFSSDTDPELAGWRFLSIGLTVSALSTLEIQDRLGPEKIQQWGDLLVRSLSPNARASPGDPR